MNGLKNLGNVKLQRNHNNIQLILLFMYFLWDVWLILRKDFLILEFPKVSDRFPSSFGTVCVLKKNAQEKDNHLAVALWTPMRSRTISIPSSS